MSKTKKSLIGFMPEEHHDFKWKGREDEIIVEVK